MGVHRTRVLDSIAAGSGSTSSMCFRSTVGNYSEAWQVGQHCPGRHRNEAKVALSAVGGVESALSVVRPVSCASFTAIAMLLLHVAGPARAQLRCHWTIHRTEALAVSATRK